MSLTNYEDDQFDQDSFPEETPPEPERKPGNKTFLILISVLGAIFVLALIGFFLFGQKLLASQQQQRLEQAARINAANTATALAATSAVHQQQTQAAATSFALTPTKNLAPTNTPVVVIATGTPKAQSTSGLSESELATVSALQTQMAGQTATATALPNTGFADEVGLPLMASLAVILILIIMLSRRLRMSSR